MKWGSLHRLEGLGYGWPTKRVLRTLRKAQGVEWRAWGAGQVEGVHFLLCPTPELTYIWPCLSQSRLSPPEPSLVPASLASHLRPSTIRFHLITPCTSRLSLPCNTMSSTSPMPAYLTALCPRHLHKAPILKPGSAAFRVCPGSPFILKLMSNSSL